MIYCSVNGCMSNNKFDNSRQFFKFPPKSLLKTKQWESFCRDPAGFKLCPKGKRFICDLHFKESDFEVYTNITTGKPVLKCDVIPSLNGPNSVRKKMHKNEKVIALVQHSEPDVEFIDHSDTPKEHNPNSPTATQLSETEYQDSNNSTYVENQNVSSGNEDKDLKIPIRKRNKFTPIKKGPYMRPKQPRLVSKYCSTGKNLKAKFEIQIRQETMKDKLDSTHENHSPDDSTFTDKTCSIFKKARKVCVSNDEKDPLRGVLVNLSSSVVFGADEDNLVQDNIEIPTSPSTAIDKKIYTPHFSEKTNNSFQQQTSNEAFDHRSEHTQTIRVTKPLKNPLTVEGENIKHFRKGRFVKQYGKTLNNRTKLLGIPLDDPNFSIAATVDSLGSFDTISSDLFEHVDVDAGEWHKLYTSNGFSFPKMPKEMIGTMVNQLRAKLPMLKDRDQLEVMFLLSMMSIYPSVPKEIQDLLHQRLNLVYIALMFKWETALALATRNVDIYKPKDLNNMPSEDNVDDGFHMDPCSTSDIFKSAINSAPMVTRSKKKSNSQNKKRNIKKNTSAKVLWKGSNLVPPPVEDSIEVTTFGEDKNKTNLKKKCFAFEIIVHEKSVNNK